MSDKSKLSCILWLNPKRYGDSKARMYLSATTNTTPPVPLSFDTNYLRKQKRYKMAFFVQNDASDDKIHHFLSISSLQEPVILPIPLAERCLGWTEFEYQKINSWDY